MAAAACEGPLSTLDPASGEAARVAGLWWVMLAASAVILAGIMGTALYALRERRGGRGVSGLAMLAGGGVAFPAATLLALLVWSLMQGPEPAAADDPDAYRLRAQAQRFQWEFIHPAGPDGRPLRTVGLAVIPVGVPVVVEIAAADVIHSFWVPRLAGKLDALPGRVNHLRLKADAPGRYAGQCAEYCGTGHADMAFVVEAVSPEDLERRLAELARGATP